MITVQGVYETASVATIIHVPQATESKAFFSSPGCGKEDQAEVKMCEAGKYISLFAFMGYYEVRAIFGHIILGICVHMSSTYNRINEWEESAKDWFGYRTKFIQKMLGLFVFFQSCCVLKESICASHKCQ